MEVYNTVSDINVFGKVVDTFPQGISKAFDELINALSVKDNRPYYGISLCENEKITYTAAALEIYAGEASKYKDYTVYTIEAGNYLCEPVYDWKSKTGSIKNVFADILKDERANNSKPAVEIYLDDYKMLCLVKMKPEDDVLHLISNKAQQITEAFASANENEINIRPYKDSWTPAQVVNHLIKSNTSVANAMHLKSFVTNRRPDKRVAELRQIFLDYSVTYQSAPFIWPDDGIYNKQLCVEAFNNSINTLVKAASAVNLSEAVSHPAFGEITKLELLFFIVFHTQRHTRQLKKIMIRNEEGEKFIKPLKT